MLHAQVLRAAALEAMNGSGLPGEKASVRAANFDRDERLAAAPCARRGGSTEAGLRSCGTSSRLLRSTSRWRMLEPHSNSSRRCGRRCKHEGGRRHVAKSLCNQGCGKEWWAMGL